MFVGKKYPSFRILYYFQVFIKSSSFHFSSKCCARSPLTRRVVFPQKEICQKKSFQNPYERQVVHCRTGTSVFRMCSKSLSWKHNLVGSCFCKKLDIYVMMWATKKTSDVLREKLVKTITIWCGEERKHVRIYLLFCTRFVWGGRCNPPPPNFIWERLL